MSEYFTGATFAMQRVAPTDDAIVRRAMLTDGILCGCTLSCSGTTLTMGAGQLMICGRQIRHVADQNWPITGATNGFARLVLSVDLTRTATKDTFDQVVTEIEYATSQNGFADLAQEDINNGASIYQVPVCVVSLGAGGITGIVEMLQLSSSVGATSMELLWENASPYGSYFEAQTIELDLSNYSHVGIEAKWVYYENWNEQEIKIFRKGSGIDGRMLEFVGADTGVVSRKITSISDSGITFEDGKKGDLRDYMTSNNVAVPTRIYGIKGVIE